MEPTDFSWALRQLRDGKRVRRAGWNGKGMWICRITHGGWDSGPDLNMYPHLPFILLKTADDCVVPWLASLTDMLANDWEPEDG